MNDKTKAILEITAPTGQEFADKGSIINQTKDLSGVCVKLYIPTKAIQKPVDTDSIQDQVAQVEADKKAYPLTWWKAWEYKLRYKDSKWQGFDKIDDILSDGAHYRRHQHATHIMQYEQDKIDYPEFYGQLWQTKNNNSASWRQIYKDPDWTADCYRQHPHRENIIKFHACSEEDKKRWQYKIKDFEWADVSFNDIPQWRDDTKYRLRPRVCFITLQDGTKMEFPEPIREDLGVGQGYWVVLLIDEIIKKDRWDGNYSDTKRLKSGLIHLTQQAAEQHLSVIQAMNAQVAV